MWDDAFFKAVCPFLLIIVLGILSLLILGGLMGWIVHYVFEIFIVKAKRVYQRSAMARVAGRRIQSCQNYIIQVNLCIL